MRLGYEIARVLKEIPSSSNDRLQRAMLLANAVGFYVKIDPSQTIDELIATNLPYLKKVIGQVNENIPLDTKLAQELFKQSLRIRYELIHGATDSAIIAMAMRSATAEVNQTPVEQLAAAALVSNIDFQRSQNSICSALATLGEAE